jgi:predicted nuclease of predicted toxin-antitoxin system
MRILLDHNIPVPLRSALEGHEVETAYERGWAELTNGELLTTAEASGFNLLITSDKGVRHQQNWSGRKLALLVLSTNDWSRIRLHRQLVVEAAATIGESGYRELEIPTADSGP